MARIDARLGPPASRRPIPTGPCYRLVSCGRAATAAVARLSPMPTRRCCDALRQHRDGLDSRLQVLAARFAGAVSVAIDSAGNHRRLENPAAQALR